MRLAEIASRPVVTIDAGAPIKDALALMATRVIHHVPVVDGNMLVGIVSDRDLISVAGYLAAHSAVPIVPCVADIMSRPVQALTPDDRIEKAARLMLREKIGAIPLLRDGQLVGIVTETDFLTCYRENRGFLRGVPVRPHGVGDYVKGYVLSVGTNDHVMETFRLMREMGIRHLPVIDDQSLVGILSERDVLRALNGLICTASEAADRGTHFGRLPHRPRVGDIMTNKVTTIKPEAALADAADCMLVHGIGALPVTDDDNRLVGIITEADFLLYVAVNDTDSAAP
jgi:CBS domain-containing protein